MDKRIAAKIDNFDFILGQKIVGEKYEVIARIGDGWESEVFLLREVETGIEKAAKFFYPIRNQNNRTFKFYAKKLHKLRHCPILMQYYTQETIFHEGIPICFLISEYIEGELLSDFLKAQPQKRINVFQGVHLLNALAKGLDPIHRLREYHGDLHTSNIIVQRCGLEFDLKVIDFYQWKAPRPENIFDDVFDMIFVFYEAIGGKRFYSKHPKEIKDIICGLKKSLIIKKYRTAGQLSRYLENFEFHQ